MKHGTARVNKLCGVFLEKMRRILYFLAKVLTFKHSRVFPSNNLHRCFALLNWEISNG